MENSVTGLPVLLNVVPFWGIRDPFSMLSHLVGALLGVGATVLLVRRARRSGLRGHAVAVYGASIVLTFTASALFHYVEGSPQRIDLFKRLDHAAIFLAVAGTGTAILATLSTNLAERLIAALWIAAIAALITKMLVWPMGLWLTALMYLALGWLGCTGLILVGRETSLRSLRLFLGGGGVLTLGAFVFATEWPVLWPGVVEGHEVFHLLVLVGVAMHVRFVYVYCTSPDALFETADALEVDVPGACLEPSRSSDTGRV